MHVSETVAGDCRLAYAIDGPAEAPPLLLLNALALTMELWAPTLASLSSSYRVIRYDARGIGQSSSTGAECSIADLGRDALAVLDAAGVHRAHVCGISLGGLTAMWLGVHAADRVDRLVLANTSARLGTRDTWIDRIAQVRASGLDAIADASSLRWFTAEFRTRAPEVVARFRAMAAAASPESYAACCAAMRDADLRGEIGSIRAETLIIGGAEDAVTPPPEQQFLASHIPHSCVVTLDAAHLSNVEQPDAFADAVHDFLS